MSFILIPFLPLIAAYRCINFYGLEVPQKTFVCSWVNPPEWYLDKMIDLISIDSIRLPFSLEYVASDDMNQMDFIISECGKRNLSVILDYHRGYSDHQGFSPVEPGITKDMWMDTLIYVLDRYYDQPHVNAISIFNEFQGFDKIDIETVQREAVLNLEARFPNRYNYMVGCSDWGKDCSDMWETLPIDNIYIEMHSYGFAAGKLPRNIDRVFVGEIGWRHEESNTFETFRSLVQTNNIRNICLWTIAHSRDTDDLFMDDCITVNQEIQNGFNSLFEPSKRQCLRRHSS